MLKGFIIGIGMAFGLVIGLVACTVGGAMSLGSALSNQSVEHISDQTSVSTQAYDAKPPVRQVAASAKSTPAPQPQSRGKLELKVESLKQGDFGGVEAIVKVVNNANRNYSMVFVDCAFLGSNGDAVESGTAMVTNLAAGQTGYGDATAMNGDGVRSVSCRLSSAL